MKFLTAATLFTLLPALSMACAVYDNCLCQNSDGSFNDDATQKACANFSGNYDVLMTAVTTALPRLSMLEQLEERFCPSTTVASGKPVTIMGPLETLTAGLKSGLRA
ncbi:hypothetical protein A1F99_141290 [Pyrenophora tritici-repentis]|nr:hypothetical protein A1F99_141290 [Pyrenophora tritici-repentis]